MSPLREGMRRALAVLDVPVPIAERLGTEYGDEVWWQLVRNSTASFAGGFSAHKILASRDELLGMGVLLSALRQGAPGVCEAVVRDENTPDYMVYWMVERKMLSAEQENVLVRGRRSKAMTWYLVHSDKLREPASKTVKRRSHFGRASRWQYTVHAPLWANVVHLLFNGYAGALANGTIEHEAQYYKGGSGLLAEVASKYFGQGEDVVSLREWDKFFDLVQAGICEDVGQMIDVAYRSGAVVEKVC
jgi:hypothetical protein